MSHSHLEDERAFGAGAEIKTRITHSLPPALSLLRTTKVVGHVSKATKTSNHVHRPHRGKPPKASSTLQDTLRGLTNPIDVNGAMKNKEIEWEEGYDQHELFG